MLIAQITDVHIGFDTPGPDEPNRRRLASVLGHLRAAPSAPDLLVASGDLTDKADAASFAELAGALAAMPFPVVPMVGNHDSRERLLRAFPDTPNDGGFVHYAIERDGLKLVILDTTEPGRHGGAFCARRRDWLAAELASAPATPTAIFMHHPPIVSGIEWMDPAPDAEWIANFAAAITGPGQVIAIHCGHLHRPLATTFRGIPLTVCPSVAPALTLDFRPIDRGMPDGRALIAAEPPAYALHRWDGARLATHFQTAGDNPVIARFDDTQRAMIEGMLAERR
jgi:3',5'-cyclic AMP phosphodiesterase CpdA